MAESARESGVTRAPSPAFRPEIYERPISAPSRNVEAKEKVANGVVQPAGDPALHQVVQPVMQHMATLTEGAQVRSRLLVGSLSKCAAASTTRVRCGRVASTRSG